MMTSTDKTELEEYQAWVTSVSSRKGLNWAVLGLTAEAGEVAGVIEHDLRKDKQTDPNAVMDELGDVLWYAAEICNSLGITLDEVIEHNIQKINKRVYGDEYVAV